MLPSRDIPRPRDRVRASMAIRATLRPRTPIISALVLFMLVQSAFAEPKTHTPARILAKQTGATQFEEERYETPADCNEHKHHLKKRASDEDVDYEVYQGVVGRPGIDFPIYPRIPKTTFSCRSFGNGYFADMETDCQVFHICEEGRKISFLCPNGTIFQQSELTCDWWFKVNCLGSSGYYAESAEILNKQRVHRVRPSVPVQGFNIVGSGLNFKPKAIASNATPTARASKPERRIDSAEDPPSAETVDFDDLSAEKQLRGAPKKLVLAAELDNDNSNSNSNDDNDNDNESQITAESSSFVGGRRRNNFETDNKEKDKEKEKDAVRVLSASPKRSSAARRDSVNSNSGSGERGRNGKRGNQRYKGDKADKADKGERPDGDASDGEKFSKAFAPVETFDPKASRRNTAKASSPAPFFPSATYTYTSGRRLDTTKSSSTAFYTPTVPTIAKSKVTDGKAFYVKGPSGSSATTPSSNRFFGLTGSASTPRPRTSTASGASTEAELPTSTYRPIVLGMRHNFDANAADRAKERRDYLPATTTAAPASTGPTYLPKSGVTPKHSGDAGGDLLLFAPNPTVGESPEVSRHVNDMLKTMSLLKDKLNEAPARAREGLDIPPSSGPDALISLAKYFAAEPTVEAPKPAENVNNNTNSSRNSTSSSSSRFTAPAAKPSDMTATLTTPVPEVGVRANDIRAGLLSEKTVAKYSNLFGLTGPDSAQQSPKEELREKVGGDKKDTIAGSEVNSFPQIGTTDATIRALAAKQESRKIAQVFSNALNTYLEDPETFREQLVSVRPTEPPTTLKYRAETTTSASATTTDSSLFKSGTAASYLPTRSTTNSPLDVTTTTSVPSIAVEINRKLDYSTAQPELVSTTESADLSTPTTTTYRPIDSLLEKKQKLLLSADELLPPDDSGESGADEFMQREQTQSFVKSRNNLNYGNSKPSQTTENPWDEVSKTDFLDPLTINDGLMKGTRTTTLSPYTYLPKETTSTASATTTTAAAPTATATATPSSYVTAAAVTKRPVSGRLEVLAEASPRSRVNFVGSAEVTTTTTPTATSGFSGRAHQTDSWHDILNSYDLPAGSLPSSSGLQRIANKLFGGLNENEALHLKNVMQQAEHNRQVLSLLLLLIQTCDDTNGRALERSRKHLLNALIDMDSKGSKAERGHEGQGNAKVSYHKGSGSGSGSSSFTTTRVPVTTYRRPGEGLPTSTLGYASTTTDLPSSTAAPSSATSTQWPIGDGSAEATTKFEIRVEDIDDGLASTTTTQSTPTQTQAPYGGAGSNLHSNSDRRALELLKSLYSLASKFNSSR